jgi:hypothetical protein
VGDQLNFSRFTEDDDLQNQRMLWEKRATEKCGLMCGMKYKQGLE